MEAGRAGKCIRTELSRNLRGANGNGRNRQPEVSRERRCSVPVTAAVRRWKGGGKPVRPVAACYRMSLSLGEGRSL